jgi:gentisate 1,2-dioxygenase
MTIVTIANINSLVAEDTPQESQDTTHALLENLESHHTKPLWAQMERLNPPLPNPTAIPHVWKYDQIRPHLLKAGELVTEKQAERRVAMLVNPARGELNVTRWNQRLTLAELLRLPLTPSMPVFSW